MTPEHYSNRNADKQPFNPFPTTKSLLLDIENNNNDTGKIIDEIKDFVQNNGKGISTSQLRNIYAKIKTIEDKDLVSIQLLRPNLAYIAARQGQQDARKFVEFIDNLVAGIKSEKQVRSFKIFMESLVAYHKFFHSKK